MNSDADRPIPAANEPELLRAAQRGEEGAFERLVAPYAYRMLGSVHDAEDAMQEAMLRAWRGIGQFEGRSSLRSWLYTIATNASLRLVERRPKRVLPVEFGPPADPHGDVAKPLVESTWIEPLPERRVAAEEASASPEAR